MEVKSIKLMVLEIMLCVYLEKEVRNLTGHFNILLATVHNVFMFMSVLEKNF